ncbi:unnamed protein product [Amoebophrya sp. A25]|nr:unnamed protein product [Amoebophrya sp. A25]|eukprot:GSA25T00027498001.1
MLGYGPVFGVASPFPWMLSVEMTGRANQFEKRATEYRKVSASSTAPAEVADLPTVAPIRLLTGAMGTMKTTTLLLEVINAAHQGAKLLNLTPVADHRSGSTIRTHSGIQAPAQQVGNLSEVSLTGLDLVALDEVHMRDPGELVTFLERCGNSGVRVIMAGIAVDGLTGQEFPFVEKCRALGVRREHLYADKCSKCEGQNAGHCVPQSLFFPRCYTASDCVGGFEKWENVCEECAEQWRREWQKLQVYHVDRGGVNGSPVCRGCGYRFQGNSAAGVDLLQVFNHFQTKHSAKHGERVEVFDREWAFCCEATENKATGLQDPRALCVSSCAVTADPRSPPGLEKA